MEPIASIASGRARIGGGSIARELDKSRECDTIAAKLPFLAWEGHNQDGLRASWLCKVERNAQATPFPGCPSAILRCS